MFVYRISVISNGLVTLLSQSLAISETKFLLSILLALPVDMWDQNDIILEFKHFKYECTFIKSTYGANVLQILYYITD